MAAPRANGLEYYFRSKPEGTSGDDSVPAELQHLYDQYCLNAHERESSIVTSANIDIDVAPQQQQQH
ncbi:hypothetical protein ColTof3_14664 [Colletotrichum tofieldiae]|nr:hypothetical protein ColTof3_14664 [Colletotrichum tofieldiae]